MVKSLWHLDNSCQSKNVYIFDPKLSLGNFFYRYTWWLSGKESACQAVDAGSIPLLGRSLEKEMATHFSILAWEIPWMEEPEGLQSMGLLKSHDIMTK